MSDFTYSDNDIEDLNTFASDILITDPTTLADAEAHDLYHFTPNVFNGKPSPSGKWRRGVDSRETATVRVFGFVDVSSKLGVLGHMEHANVRWLTADNMARTQKQELVLCLPQIFPSRSAVSRLMTRQSRNLYYIQRKQAGQPDLDWVMEDESREELPTNRSHFWIKTSEGETFVTLTSKMWQDTGAKASMGGSLPRNLYSPRALPQSSRSPTSSDDYTMASWPNPKNHDYARDPAARNYRLAPLDAFDENDKQISRADFGTALRPGTVVVVDVVPVLWRIQDSPKTPDARRPDTWTDTYQLVMQQIKVIKYPLDVFGTAVYMSDLGGDAPQTSPTNSNKRRATSPVLDLSPPAKRPLPSSPSKSKALFANAFPFPMSSQPGPSFTRRSATLGRDGADTASEDPLMHPAEHSNPAIPPWSPADADLLLVYDSDELIDVPAENPDDEVKPKVKGKGKGKGKAK